MDITNLTKIYHIHKNYKAKKTRIMWQSTENLVTINSAIQPSVLSFFFFKIKIKIKVIERASNLAHGRYTTDTQSQKKKKNEDLTDIYKFEKGPGRKS